MEAEHQNIDEQIDELEELLLDGTRIPFSSVRLVDENEALESLHRLKESIPIELINAKSLLNNRQEYLQTAKLEAENLVNKAIQKRNKIIDQSDIIKQIDEEVNTLREKGNKEYKRIIERTNKEVKYKLQEMNKELIRLRVLQKTKRNEIDKETAKMQIKHKNQTDYYIKELNCKRSQYTYRLQEEITELINKKSRLIDNSNFEAAKIKSDAIAFKEQTRQECKRMIENTKLQAEKLKDEAIRTTQRSIYESEKKVKELRINKNI